MSYAMALAQDWVDPYDWGDINWDRLERDFEALQHGDLSNEEFFRHLGASADVVCLAPAPKWLVLACRGREMMRDATVPDWYSEEDYGMPFDQYCAKIGGKLIGGERAGPTGPEKWVDCEGGDPSRLEKPLLPPCAYTPEGCPEPPPHKLEIDGACPDGMHKVWGPDGTETCAFDEPTPQTQCPAGCEHVVHPVTGGELCIGGPCAKKPTVHPPTPQGKAAYQQMKQQTVRPAGTSTPTWLVLAAALAVGVALAAATEGS
jgi:hypothetical protein